MTKETLLALIKLERVNQDKKWGEQNHNDGDWALILAEEIGEASKASLEGQGFKMVNELIQAAAVIVAWLEAVDRRPRIEKQAAPIEVKL